MRSFLEALDVALYGVDNERILGKTKIPWLFLPTVESPDQNLAVGSVDGVGKNDEWVEDIPFTFIVTPIFRTLISLPQQKV